MIQKEEIKIQSEQDGLWLGVSIRIPEQPIGILQLVHGMAEHRERYFEVMDFFADHGYVTIMHDHRGHGESVRSPRDYGFFYKNGASAMVEDTHQITLYIKERFQNLPVILLGHSMGSMVVRCYVRQYDDAINGLIVCGSPSKNRMAKMGLALAKSMIKAKGAWYRSDLIQKIAFGSFGGRFANEASENAWICSDLEVVQHYDQDSRCGFVFTLNGFAALFELMATTYQPKGWALHNPSLPILFIAGEDDPCIVSRTAFMKAVRFMRERGYTACESKLYPNMRHEILNETRKEMVYQDLADWMQLHNLAISRTKE
ncbi:MAG: alpha/beta hydrolase [Clostridiales bacterium]|nr:alpha/beta hydrolase [Clostridiales bacterium]